MDGPDDPWLSRYIPVGCIDIPIDKDGTRPELEAATTLEGWTFLTRDGLLNSPELGDCEYLWRHFLLQLSFAVVSISPSRLLGRMRVYMLPYDVGRGNRSSRNEFTVPLRKVLSQLCHSRDAWAGTEPHTCETSMPYIKTASSMQGDPSLLALFNNIPSPDPRPELVEDGSIRHGMEELLENKPRGLSSTLHPYQGRTAALMLQRESAPGRVEDPRFRPLLDQTGRPWYYDSVTGIPLRQPHYYDEVCGGLLAEEMGTGKTVIVLALILTTKNVPVTAPEPYVAEVLPRPKDQVPSLMDLAAAAANKNAVAWKRFFKEAEDDGDDYQLCINALARPENRAFYYIRERVEARRSGRLELPEVPLKQVYLSSTTLVIVPENLVRQWQEEIKKHTPSLNVLVLVGRAEIPSVTELMAYDVLLFSDTRFEMTEKVRQNGEGPAIPVYCPLEHIRFKRCVVDEGHKLGNGGNSWKSNVMRALARLEIAARWVVTGTPSRGLYGVDQPTSEPQTPPGGPPRSLDPNSMKQEEWDIRRICNIAIKFLNVRPWSITKEEAGDSDRKADYRDYMLHADQYKRGHDRRDVLANTLNSLVVRHRMSEIGSILPPVNEKVVVLDGSYQDQISLNLFAMIIVFNAVQSQRTDRDYFFHEGQRKFLNLLVRNLRQACFVGGVFFPTEDINTAVETAEEFLTKKSIPISEDDEKILHQAISFGKLAARNHLKQLCSKYHVMPLYVEKFPGGRGQSWSLDDTVTEDGLICTEAGLVRSLQKYLNPCIDAPMALRLLLENGRLDLQGVSERAAMFKGASGDTNTAQQNNVLAGKIGPGLDYHPKPKSTVPETGLEVELEREPQLADTSNIQVAVALAGTRVVSTASAKLSYLIDAIVKYQDQEQIIVFFDIDNVAWYLAQVLEILQIQHLIYTSAGLNAARRAQYVATFTHNPKFRVLLMDINQAAFGLDMRSASRIYFTSPVLNPQVQAQAIGRVRRISQEKPVTVETLVLRDSIEEVIVNRRDHMSQTDCSRVKDILDDQKIYQWIKNAAVKPMDEMKEGVAQTAKLDTPQFVFGRGFGRDLHPDEGLVPESPESRTRAGRMPSKGTKRSRSSGSSAGQNNGASNPDDVERAAKKRVARVRFAS
ncbi:P-loop containing nucleoside triphosphate hydrolase protein [Xylariomycetidae sp. FL0641]|nr:P-loop containing nucleoside triphosphate hydrolase protein [Xylariomycetidae sp. FL0641]